jgi:predicted aspartyl protease
LGRHTAAIRPATYILRSIQRLAWSVLLVPACVIAAQSLAPGRADRAVQQFNTKELREAIGSMSNGPQRAYFSGVLASREGRDGDCIRLLTSALPSLRSTRPDRAAVALRLLADAFDRTFAYSRAVAAYDELLEHFSSQLESTDLHGAQDDSSLAKVLARSPGQTIAWRGPVRISIRRDNPLGLITTDLTVNGVLSPWILDTGANQTVVSRSFAMKLGLKMLPGHSQTAGGVTGIENPLQAAILPTLAIGGATLHNVVLLVLDDPNMTISNGKGQQYTIPAIIGFPVLRALGKLTFRHAGLLDANANGVDSNAGSPLELKLLNPVAEPVVEHQMLPFTIDTGASSTTLSVRFYRQFQSEKSTWNRVETKSFGAGGGTSTNAYLVPSLPLTVGGRTIVLKHLAVLPSAQGADIDVLFGNIGEDLLQSVASFTLDFTQMRFVLGQPLARSPTKPGSRTTSVP